MSKVHRLAAMAPEHVLALDVERRLPRSARATPGTSDGRDEQEHGLRIDEAADEPGAGDAVDLGTRAGHPDGAALPVAGRELRPPGPSAGRPAPMPTPRPRGSPPGMPACRSQAATPWLSFRPFWQMTMADWPANSVAHSETWEGPADGAGDQARVGGEVLVGLDVDEDRASGRADQAGELVDGDGVDRRHDDASLLKESWTRCLGMSPREEIAVPMAQVGTCRRALSTTRTVSRTGRTALGAAVADLAAFLVVGVVLEAAGRAVLVDLGGDHLLAAADQRDVRLPCRS